jgi:hypothetical protein
MQKGRGREIFIIIVIEKLCYKKSNRVLNVTSTLVMWTVDVKSPSYRKVKGYKVKRKNVKRKMRNAKCKILTNSILTAVSFG